jgi:tetratricopeptide (TPR) repeat protein
VGRGSENARQLLAQKGSSTDDKVLANFALAKAAQSNNECESAIGYFRSVVSMNKASYGAESRYEIASCLFAQDKLKEAEAAAFEVVNKAGSYAVWVTRAYILLGDIYFKQKDYFNAKATFQSVVQNAGIPELKSEAQSKLDRVLEAESRGKQDRKRVTKLNLIIHHSLLTMTKNPLLIKYIFFVCACLVAHHSMAQDTSKRKTIEITSTFKPVLREAAKINFNAAPPSVDSSRPLLNYSIPVQNLFFTYQPASINPVALPMDSLSAWQYSNYVKVGAGNVHIPSCRQGLVLVITKAPSLMYSLITYPLKVTCLFKRIARRGLP